MLELLKMPDVWFGAAAVVGSGLAGYIVFEAIGFEFRRRRVEREPIIDMNLFEAEMSMEAAVLECRLADQRRAEMLARMQ